MKHFVVKFVSSTLHCFRRVSITAMAAWALFFHPFYAYAADPTVQDTFTDKNKTGATDPTTVTTISNPGWSAAINTIVALAILVAIIYFLLKLVNRKLVQNRSTAGIQILAQQALTSNRSIHLLEIGGQVYVVGVGESVTFLDKIEDQEVIRQLKEHADNEDFIPSSNRWTNGYQKIVSLFPVRKQSQTEDGFKETLEKQLQSMRQMKDTFDNNSNLHTDNNIDQT